MAAPPPPPPPPLPSPTQQQGKAIALKVRDEAPPLFVRSEPKDDPPQGLYFFYGTLQDPELLQDILSLPDRPSLHPAYIAGYELKLWGPYPALVGPGDGRVEGAAFQVTTQEIAKRLQQYETSAYCPGSCVIYTRDGENQSGEEGFVFQYCGNPRDLSEGVFDLNVFLRRMGRRT
jgi:gamma-glutamylcyclotransferase (GGCT)/AIG2-like uncharacterized protein YtfP